MNLLPWSSIIHYSAEMGGLASFGPPVDNLSHGNYAKAEHHHSCRYYLSITQEVTSQSNSLSSASK